MITAEQVSGKTADYIKRETERMEKAQKVSELVNQILELVGDDAQMLRSVVSCIRPTGSGTGFSPNWGRLVTHFRSTGNEYMTMPGITKILGITRGSVCGILYNVHSGDVEFAVNPERKGGRLWRLKASVLAEVAKG